VTTWVVQNDQAAVLPAYAARLLSELDTITSAIPSDQLAIQWDVAVEIGVLERLFPTGFTGAAHIRLADDTWKCGAAGG
jgi:hypothetical protein